MSLSGRAEFVRCSLSYASQQSKATLRLTRASFGLALPLYCHRFLTSAVAVKLWLSPHAALLLTVAVSVLQALFRQAAQYLQPSRNPCYCSPAGQSPHSQPPSYLGLFLAVRLPLAAASRLGSHPHTLGSAGACLHSLPIKLVEGGNGSASEKSCENLE